MGYRSVLGLLGITACIVGGCPQNQSGDLDSGVVARIGISSTRGEAPLTVVVNAVDSTSRFGEIVAYEWDFAGQATSADAEALHTFETPGRHTIALRVRDSAGNEGVATEDVRVAGGGVVAIIQTDAAAGPAPLTAHFDGRASSAEGDVIRDYFWDFGDGATSRVPDPRHVFANSGTYTVKLRVVSAGGLEATAEAVIEVSTRNRAALQLAGGQLASLPVTAPEPLAACTFEAWFKAEAIGGTLASIGSQAMTVAVFPAQELLRVTVAGETLELAAADLAGIWHHIAVSFDSSTGFTVVLDGEQIGDAEVQGDLTLAGLTIGPGYQGKAAEVRVWSVARGVDDVVGSRGSRLSGGEPDLLGNWRINEGAGQTLGNTIPSGAAGTLGSTTEAETTDPAWSTDGPPLP